MAEAINAVGGNESKLLEIIGAGLVADQKAEIEKSQDGWLVSDGDGNLSEFSE